MTMKNDINLITAEELLELFNSGKDFAGHDIPQAVTI
jgi:hypothetical protein